MKKKLGSLRIRANCPREKENPILPQYDVRTQRKLCCDDTCRADLYDFKGAFRSRDRTYTKGKGAIRAIGMSNE